MREPAHRPGHHPRPITRPQAAMPPSAGTTRRHDAPAALAKLVAMACLVLQYQAKRPRRRPHPVRQPTREVVQKSRAQSSTAAVRLSAHARLPDGFQRARACIKAVSRVMVCLGRLSRAAPEVMSARPPLYMPWPWFFANHESHRHTLQ